MQYSEYPHEHYLTAGVGPGSEYVGDLERWNWRWLFAGTEINSPFDLGVSKFFNDEQRRLMQLPPLEALEHIQTFLPDDVTGEVLKRGAEAHARLSPQKVTAREDNVIFGNFGKR